MPNNPIPDAELEELRRLHAAATPGELRSVGYRLSHSLNTRIEYNVEHIDEIGQARYGSPYQAIPFARQEDASWHAALHNAFGPILARLETAEMNLAIQTTSASMRGGSLLGAYKQIEELQKRLEAAERERDEWTTMAARAQEALRYVMNGLPTNDAVWSAYGNADSARAWLAARDAQQRREGAIEALEGIAKDHGIDGGKAYIAKVVYREFPDLLHMSVGVVDAADLMQAAKRLREGGN